MKKKILVVLLILVFLYCIGGVAYSIFVRQHNNKKKINRDNDIVKIDGYDYEMLKSKSTEIYKDNFMELKDNLESGEIDFKKYASSVAKLYIIDFYTLSNKVNKYDVGSVQYVYLDAQENFRLKASETLYKYVIDNTNNDRDQKLPEVSEIMIEKLEEGTFAIDSDTYDSYIIDLNWIYKEEMGYETNARLTLVKRDNVISVVEESRG